MDKATKLAILSVLEVSQEVTKEISESRTLVRQIHKALVTAGVPGYLDAYEHRDDDSLFKLTDAKNKLAKLVAAGGEAIRKNCAG